MSDDPPSVPQRRVTRDVAVAALRDLTEQPARATVAFVERDAVDLLPALARLDGGRYLFALLAGAALDLEAREVVLVIDAGAYWFELRGISVRGTAVRVEPPHGRGAERLVWYTIAARRVLAWDYGAIRED